MPFQEIHCDRADCNNMVKVTDNYLAALMTKETPPAVCDYHFWEQHRASLRSRGKKSPASHG